MQLREAMPNAFMVSEQKDRVSAQCHHYQKGYFDRSR